MILPGEAQRTQAEWQQQLMQGSHGTSSSGQEDARRRVRVNRGCRGAQKQTTLRCFVLRPPACSIRPALLLPAARLAAVSLLVVLTAQY